MEEPGQLWQGGIWRMSLAWNREQPEQDPRALPRAVSRSPWELCEHLGAAERLPKIPVQGRSSCSPAEPLAAPTKPSES